MLVVWGAPKWISWFLQIHYSLESKSMCTIVRKIQIICTIDNFPIEILQLNLDKFQRCTQSAFRDKRKGRLMLALGLGERQIYLLLAATYLPSWALTPRNFVTILCISQPLCVHSVLYRNLDLEKLSVLSPVSRTLTQVQQVPGTVRNSLLIVTMSFT